MLPTGKTYVDAVSRRHRARFHRHYDRWVGRHVERLPRSTRHSVFFPRNDTPGCTIEACSFRDNIDQLTTRGVDVFGVSDDDARSHEKFTEKYALNFQLLADTDHRMIESYGAWVEKRQYGRKFMGAKRVTYLIGADGSVEHVWLDVEPAAHVEEILSVLES